MLKFIANLFAAKTTPTLKVRLSVNAMEDRNAPSLFVNPGTIRGFNPQPEPPGSIPVSSAAYVSPLAEAGGVEPTPFRVG